MGLLTFGLNVTLDGCIDHTQGIVDDELHDYWTQLMDQSGAMLFGRNTYELMERAWPALAAALEELGLIDEYRIVVHPIISGRGPTLFHGLPRARHLELLSTQRFKSGVQALHFRRKAG